jgi:Ca-activated chloride channel family protein
MKLNPGKHTVIPIETPQGYIELKRPQGIYNFNEKIKTIVRLSNSDMKTLTVQQMNSTEKYITGSYDLEILTLPRTYINQVIVKQSETKLIEIPNAGLLSVKALENGDGCILKEGKKLEWVCNLGIETSQKFHLQPGSYRIEWRSKTLKGSIYTIEKRFNINSDQETRVELYK